MEREMRFIPAWVPDLVRKCNGGDIGFVMEKTLFSSDIVKQQNRLLIKEKYVEHYLLPALLEPEKVAANLVNHKNKNKRKRSDHDIDDGGARKKKMKVEEEAIAGLAVTVYNRAGWKFFLTLKRWESSGATIINGEELNILRVWSKFKASDQIEMWSFRQGDNRKLCFVIGKKFEEGSVCIDQGGMQHRFGSFESVGSCSLLC